MVQKAISSDIGVKINQLATALERSLGPAATFKALRLAMNATGAQHDRWMNKRFRPYTSPRARGRLQVRSGNMRSSLGWDLKGSSTRDLRLKLWIGSKQTKVQEFGGVISARGRALTIPAPWILNGSGLIKGRHVLRQDGGTWRTDDGPTFITEDKKGRGQIAQRGDDGELQVLYFLRKSIRIKPRLGFFDTYRKRTKPFLEKRLSKRLFRAIQAGMKGLK